MEQYRKRLQCERLQSPYMPKVQDTSRNAPRIIIAENGSTCAGSEKHPVRLVSSASVVLSGRQEQLVNSIGSVSESALPPCATSATDRRALEGGGAGSDECEQGHKEAAQRNQRD